MTLSDDYFSVTADYDGYKVGATGWDRQYIQECPSCLVIHETKHSTTLLCEKCTPVKTIPESNDL